MKNFHHYFHTTILIISILFSTVNNIAAQSMEIDSTLKLFSNTKDLEKQFNLSLTLCNLIYEDDSTRAFGFAYKAYEIAKQQQSLKNKAIVYERLSFLANKVKNSKRILYADSSLYFATASNDEEAMAYANYAMAYKYEIIGEGDKFVSSMLSALNYFEKAKKKYSIIQTGYANLSNHFSMQANLLAADKYAKKCLHMAYEGKNNIDIANALITCGGTWLNDFENSTNKNLLDSAEFYFLKAISIFENNIGKSGTQLYYARACINLLQLYVYNLHETKPAEALATLSKTEKICLKLRNKEPQLLMALYGMKTQFFMDNKNIVEVEHSLAKVNELIKGDTNIPALYIAAYYGNCMELAELKNNFRDYINYFHLYDSARSVMLDKENTTKDFNASIKFETEKKNSEIKLLTSSVAANKKIKYLFIGIAALSLLSLLFMFRSYYFRQKNLIKAQALLQEEKDKAELTSKLSEEEAMNALMGKELADQDRLVAIQENLLTLQQKEKLEQELMSNSLQLERKNKFLKELKEKLPSINSSEKNDITRLSRTIDKSLEVDEEFDLLKTSFENTNPKFFAQLQEKAENNLTKLDLKYCGYIKLGMRTKEIANLMSIEPKSMRMARYRIKLKLTLDKEVDLDDYILAI